MAVKQGVGLQRRQSCKRQQGKLKQVAAERQRLLLRRKREGPVWRQGLQRRQTEYEKKRKRKKRERGGDSAHHGRTLVSLHEAMRRATDWWPWWVRSEVERQPVG